MNDKVEYIIAEQMDGEVFIGFKFFGHFQPIFKFNNFDEFLMYFNMMERFIGEHQMREVPEVWMRGWDE